MKQTRLNTALLIVLIILVIGIIWMLWHMRKAEDGKDAGEKQIRNRSEAIANIKSVDHAPIRECSLEGETYFFTQGSIFDGSDNIYNDEGSLLASCGGGWGIKPDPYPALCTSLETVVSSCVLIEE